MQNSQWLVTSFVLYLRLEPWSRETFAVDRRSLMGQTNVILIIGVMGGFDRNRKIRSARRHQNSVL